MIVKLCHEHDTTITVLLYFFMVIGHLGNRLYHYIGVIMGTIASQITSLTIVCSTVYSGADQRKHQSSASLAFVRGIHRWPVNSPHKWPVTRKMLPFYDVIMKFVAAAQNCLIFTTNNARVLPWYRYQMRDDCEIMSQAPLPCSCIFSWSLDIWETAYIQDVFCEVSNEMQMTILWCFESIVPVLLRDWSFDMRNYHYLYTPIVF